MAQGQIIFTRPDEDDIYLKELIIGTTELPLTLLPSDTGYFHIATPHPMILEMTTHPTLMWPSVNPGGNMGVMYDEDIAVARTLLHDGGQPDAPIDLNNAEQAIKLPSTDRAHTAFTPGGALGLRFVVWPTPGVTGVTIYATSLFNRLVVSSASALHVEAQALRQLGVGIEDDRV